MGAASITSCSEWAQRALQSGRSEVALELIHAGAASVLWAERWEPVQSLVLARDLVQEFNILKKRKLR